jgi:hypothetical protein
MLILAEERIAKIKLNQRDRERRSIDRSTCIAVAEIGDPLKSEAESDFVLQLKEKGKREQAKFYLPICRLICANAPSDASRQSLFDELRFHPGGHFSSPREPQRVHCARGRQRQSGVVSPVSVPTLYLARTVVKLL